MGWQDQTWGATPILAGVYFLSLSSIDRIGMSFFFLSCFFSAQREQVLFTKGLDILLQHIGQPQTHTTEQTQQFGAADISAYTFFSSSMSYLGFAYLQFCRLVLITVQTFFHHSFTIISIFIEGACLAGFLRFCFLFASDSLSYICFISTSYPGDFAPLVFTRGKAELVCCM